MADKTKNPIKSQASPKAPAPKEAPKSRFKLIKVLFILFLLTGIVGAAGLAAGVYFKFIDLQKLNQTYKLHQYPLLNQYFSPPQTNFELVPLAEQENGEVEQKQEVPLAPPVSAPVAEAPKPEVPKVDLEKEIKARQLEEQKRLSKLARLYGGMKAEEAVAIMNELDDETVLAILGRMEDEQVSRILALFDTRKAASLTREMMKTKSVASDRL